VDPLGSGSINSELRIRIQILTFYKDFKKITKLSSIFDNMIYLHGTTTSICFTIYILTTTTKMSRRIRIQIRTVIIWPPGLVIAVIGVGGMVCDSDHRGGEGGEGIVGGEILFFFGAGDLWEDSLLKLISMKVLH
jgi:hypothetical protein